MRTYRIQRGDTLSALAARFRTTVSRLAEVNHISNVNLIITGHTLRVPGTVEAPRRPSPGAPQRTPARRPEPGRSTVPSHRVGRLPRTGNAFLDRYGPSAVRSMHRTGVPASVTMAQAILESGWGRSGLTKRAFNFFGIKGTGPAGSVTVRTREVYNGRSVYINAAFRKYHNAEESFVDHGRMLRRMSRYARCFRFKNDPAQFCRELQRAGYATDPRYASILISLIRQYRLDRYDRA
jgi:flagellum-specific peptidoglycan hydrolase FlgJ